MAAPPSFIFHIGPHKTGTTYLQLRFAAERPALAARGIVYPDIWSDGPAPGHVGLPAGLRAGDITALRDGFSHLLAARAQTILISAEDLAALGAGEIAMLHDLLDGRPAQFVFYARRWSELLPSIWQERVKHGQGVTLPEFLVMGLRNPEEWAPLNYALRLRNFTQIFGPSCLSLVSYSEVCDRGIDLFAHFAGNFLGWPDAPVQPVSINASRDTAAIEIIRLLNTLSRQQGAVHRDALRVAFDRMQDRACLEPVTAAISAYTRSIRIADRWPSLATLHAMLAETYHASMVPPRRPKMLFKPGLNDVPFADQAYLTEPDIAATLRALHARLCRSLEPVP